MAMPRRCVDVGIDAGPIVQNVAVNTDAEEQLREAQNNRLMANRLFIPNQFKYAGPKCKPHIKTEPEMPVFVHNPQRTHLD